MTGSFGNRAATSSRVSRTRPTRTTRAPAAANAADTAAPIPLLAPVTIAFFPDRSIRWLGMVSGTDIPKFGVGQECSGRSVGRDAGGGLFQRDDVAGFSRALDADDDAWTGVRHHRCDGDGQWGADRADAVAQHGGLLDASGRRLLAAPACCVAVPAHQARREHRGGTGRADLDARCCAHGATSITIAPEQDAWR